MSYCNGLRKNFFQTMKYMISAPDLTRADVSQNNKTIPESKCFLFSNISSATAIKCNHVPVSLPLLKLSLCTVLCSKDMEHAASLLDFLQQILHSFHKFTKWFKRRPLGHTAVGYSPHQQKPKCV